MRGHALGTTYHIPAAAGAVADDYDFPVDYTAHSDDIASVGYPAAAGQRLETVNYGYSGDLDLAQTATGRLDNGDGTTSSYQYVTGTTYDQRGPLGGRSYGLASGTATRTYGYAADTLRLSKIATTVTWNGATSTVQDDRYGYDDTGNVTSVHSLADTSWQCFRYDDLARLSVAFTPPAATTDCASASPASTDDYWLGRRPARRHLRHPP